MKYVVAKEFLDRFDNMRHCKPGDPHVPQTEERAAQLIEQGFIAAVEEQKATRKRKSGVSTEDDGHGEENESK